MNLHDFTTEMQVLISKIDLKQVELNSRSVGLSVERFLEMAVTDSLGYVLENPDLKETEIRKTQEQILTAEVQF